MDETTFCLVGLGPDGQDDLTLNDLIYYQNKNKNENLFLRITLLIKSVNLEIDRLKIINIINKSSKILYILIKNIIKRIVYEISTYKDSTLLLCI